MKSHAVRRKKDVDVKRLGEKAPTTAPTIIGSGHVGRGRHDFFDRFGGLMFASLVVPVALKIVIATVIATQ